jgi:hypothetical protein
LRHDAQHNDIQHNDTQHKGLICDIQHNNTVIILNGDMLSVVMLNVVMLRVVVLGVVMLSLAYIIAMLHVVAPALKHSMNGQHL